MNDCNNSDNEEETVNIVVILYNVHICCVIAGTVFQYSAVVFQLFSWEKLYWEVKFCCVFLLWAKSKMGKNEISVFFIFLSNFSLWHSFLSVIVTITTSLTQRKFLKTYNENEKFLTDWSKKFL